MNRDDIICMAIEAGLDVTIAESNLALLERFAVLIAAREREACAEVCEKWVNDEAFSEEYWDAFADCAKRIRKRGKQ